MPPMKPYIIRRSPHPRQPYRFVVWDRGMSMGEYGVVIRISETSWEAFSVHGLSLGMFRRRRDAADTVWDKGRTGR